MTCPHCGKELNPSDRFCTGCGHRNESFHENRETPLNDVSAKDEPADTQLYPRDAFDKKPSMEPALEKREYPPNTRFDTPPQEISNYTPTQGPGKFNWGAFTLTVAWGIGNRVYLCLLALIPGINLIMSLLAGFKGNDWALENNRYRDLEEFSKIQETWNRAGFIFFIIAIIPSAFILLLALFGLFTAPFLI